MALSFAATSNPSPVSPERRAEILAAPGFGQFMTDHMVRATWSEGEGWHSGELTAYGNISISPAASVLHYAPEIFEGLKAYRHEGRLGLDLPPGQERRATPGQRAPDGPPGAADRGLPRVSRVLVEADEAWVPAYGDGEKSLYLRPFMFGSQAFIGLKPVNEATYMVIASLAASIFRAGRSRSPCGSARTTPAPAPVARARPSAAATTPAPCAASSRAPRTGATRRSTSIPRRTPMSTNSAG